MFERLLSIDDKVKHAFTTLSRYGNSGEISYYISTKHETVYDGGSVNSPPTIGVSIHLVYRS